MPGTKIMAEALASKFSLKELDDMQINIAQTIPGLAPVQAELDSAILELEIVAQARALVKAEDERLRASVTILREIG